MINPFIHEIFQTVRVLSKELNEELQPHELFHTQWATLYYIKKNGPMGISAISKYFNVEAPTISRTVTRLEQLGWVGRHEGKDKREKVVHLTDKALLELKEINESVVRFEHSVINRISEDEQEILHNILAKLKIER